jgi:hypothetical protein
VQRSSASISKMSNVAAALENGILDARALNSELALVNMLSPDSNAIAMLCFLLYWIAHSVVGAPICTGGLKLRRSLRHTKTWFKRHSDILQSTRLCVSQPDATGGRSVDEHSSGMASRERICGRRTRGNDTSKTRGVQMAPTVCVSARDLSGVGSNASVSPKFRLTSNSLVKLMPAKRAARL